jgi:elongation factor P
MKMSANSIRPGNVLQYKNRLWVVLKISHTQPGKGGAFIQAEMKDIKEGTKLNERFRSTEDVEKAHLDSQEYQYLFADDHNLTLMDNSTYEQIEIARAFAGDSIVYLDDGMNVTVVSYEGEPISIELPEQVVLEIVETEPVVKGQTAASSNKPAILKNGVRVMVPPFISVGDRVVVRTTDSSYIEREKK